MPEAADLFVSTDRKWRMDRKLVRTVKPQGPPPAIPFLPRRLYFIKIPSSFVIVSLTGHQGFKFRNLWGTFHSLTATRNKQIQEWCADVNSSVIRVNNVRLCRAVSRHHEESIIQKGKAWE